MSNSKKVVWITGANKGIGAALTEQGATREYTVAATSRKNSIHETHYIHPFICDVQSSESIKNCYDEIIGKCGHIDILINNAGVATFEKLWEISIEDADSMLDTNLRGTWLCTKTVLPSMIECKSGVIVNIHSVAAIKTFTYSSVYAATKAGTLAMSRSLREEVREFGIKVIDILPGATETEIWDSGSRNEFRHRMIRPIDIAKIVWQAIELSGGPALLEEIIIRPQLGDL